MRWFAVCVLVTAIAGLSSAQATFDVASIKPSAATVPFERDGQTSLLHGTLQMRDIRLRACLAYAYGLTTSQIRGHAALDQRYDITAKTVPAVPESTVRQMLRALLAERFQLVTHSDETEMRGYSLSFFSVPKDPAKFHHSATNGPGYHQNSASGTVAHNLTMAEFAEFLSSPLDAPVTDATGLTGQYDLALDFTPYVDLTRSPDHNPGPYAVLNAALKGELGLQLISAKARFKVLVVDHVGALTPD